MGDVRVLTVKGWDDGEDDPSFSHGASVYRRHILQLSKLLILMNFVYGHLLLVQLILHVHISQPTTSS